MACNEFFHHPTYFKCASLTTDQENKEMQFVFSHPVMETAAITVTVKGQDKIIKRYTNGEGFVLSNDNKTLLLTLNGNVFQAYSGRTLVFNMGLFGIGDNEAYFEIIIIKGVIK
jgi:hypothetical protein